MRRRAVPHSGHAPEPLMNSMSTQLSHLSQQEVTHNCTQAAMFAKSAVKHSCLQLSFVSLFVSLFCFVCLFEPPRNCASKDWTWAVYGTWIPTALINDNDRPFCTCKVQVTPPKNNNNKQTNKQKTPPNPNPFTILDIVSPQKTKKQKHKKQQKTTLVDTT